MPDKQMPFVRSVRLSGPPVAQRIDIGEAVVVIRISEAYVVDHHRTYSFGPIWLPLIPTLFNWFPSKPKSSDLEIDVNIENIKNTISWDLSKTCVILSDGQKAFPFKITDQANFTLNTNEILKIEKSKAVRFHFSPKQNVKEFALIIEGLSSLVTLEGIPITINFQYAKGWVMGLFP